MSTAVVCSIRDNGLIEHSGYVRRWRLRSSRQIHSTLQVAANAGSHRLSQESASTSYVPYMSISRHVYRTTALPLSCTWPVCATTCPRVRRSGGSEIIHGTRHDVFWASQQGEPSAPETRFERQNREQISIDTRRVNFSFKKSEFRCEDSISTLVKFDDQSK